MNTTYNVDDQIDAAKPALRDLLSIDNMPNLLLVMNSLLPRSSKRLLGDDRATVIAAAQYDACVDFVNRFIEKANDLRLK